jgi:hypothetical protein
LAAVLPHDYRTKPPPRGLFRHGGIGAQHVEVYLDEFIFRFNRRQSNARGLLFYRLLQNAVVVKKLDYDTIVWSRRGQAGKRRGPQPKPKAKRALKGRAAAKAKTVGAP